MAKKRAPHRSVTEALGLPQKGMTSHRIDLRKKQKPLSAGAAFYASKTEEELTALAERAQKDLADFDALPAQCPAFAGDGFAPEALAADMLTEICALTRLEAEALAGKTREEVRHKIYHVLRMSREGAELARIRKEKAFTKTATDILYPRGQELSPAEQLLGGQK